MEKPGVLRRVLVFLFVDSGELAVNFQIFFAYPPLTVLGIGRKRPEATLDT